MIRYHDLVDYIKESHVNWDTELFTVLKGFFEWYCKRQVSLTPSVTSPIQQNIKYEAKEFKAPESGEYTAEDVMDLFST